MAAKLEDSNLANYGSEEHKAMRKAVSEKEPAWEGVGGAPGVRIWRIEQFKVIDWPKDQYGEFYNGDSYIILHTKVDDEGKKSYDVFFWLGSQTTQDEMGTAAYKTVELDDYLSDEPVQYREVEGNETKRFFDLFDKVTILEGGVESGFFHVKPTEYKPRLLHVTGYKKHVQVFQVPIRCDSLNNTDSFVLDAGLKIYQFNGTKSSAWEKRKAGAIVAEICDQRMGKVKEKYVIDGIEEVGHALVEEFWGHFGGRPSDISAHEESKVPDEIEMSIHKVSTETGRMECSEVSRGKLDKSVLESDDVFIIDGGSSVFIWVGNGANASEKKEAFHRAVEYLLQTGRTHQVPIARVSEGKETDEFWSLFGGQRHGGRQTNSKEWNN